MAPDGALGAEGAAGTARGISITGAARDIGAAVCDVSTAPSVIGAAGLAAAIHRAGPVTAARPGAAGTLSATGCGAAGSTAGATARTGAAAAAATGDATAGITIAAATGIATGAAAIEAANPGISPIGAGIAATGTATGAACAGVVAALTTADVTSGRPKPTSRVASISPGAIAARAVTGTPAAATSTTAAGSATVGTRIASAAATARAALCATAASVTLVSASSRPAVAVAATARSSVPNSCVISRNPALTPSGSANSIPISCSSIMPSPQRDKGTVEAKRTWLTRKAIYNPGPQRSCRRDPRPPHTALHPPRALARVSRAAFTNPRCIPPPRRWRPTDRQHPRVHFIRQHGVPHAHFQANSEIVQLQPEQLRVAQCTSIRPGPPCNLILLGRTPLCILQTSSIPTPPWAKPSADVRARSASTISEPLTRIAAGPAVPSPNPNRSYEASYPRPPPQWPHPFRWRWSSTIGRPECVSAYLAKGQLCYPASPCARPRARQGRTALCPTGQALHPLLGPRRPGARTGSPSCRDRQGPRTPGRRPSPHASVTVSPAAASTRSASDG